MLLSVKVHKMDRSGDWKCERNKGLKIEMMVYEIPRENLHHKPTTLLKHHPKHAPLNLL